MLYKMKKTSFKNTPKLTLRKKSGVSPFNSVKVMKNKKYISKALWECIVANDTEGFKEILRAHLALVQKEEFAKKAD